MAARQIYKASSTGESTSTVALGLDGTLATKVSLEWTSDAEGSWIVLASAELKGSSSAEIALACIGVDQGDGVEPDTIMGGIAPTDTTNWYSVHGAVVVSSDGPGETLEVAIMFGRLGLESATTTIRNARLVAIRMADETTSGIENFLGDDFRDFDGQTNSTSYVGIGDPPLEISTYDTDDEDVEFLIIALGTIGNTGATYRSGIRGVIDGTETFGEIYGVLAANEESIPVALMTRTTLAANANHTIDIELKTQNAAGEARAYGVIVALRLDRFGDFAYTEDTSEQGGVIGTAYTAVESLTHSMLAGDYLGLMSASNRNMWNSHDLFLEARAGGTALATTQVEGRDNTSPYSRNANFFLWFGDSQAAGSKSFDLRHKHEHASGTGYTKDAKIALLGLDVASMAEIGAPAAVLLLAAHAPVAAADALVTVGVLALAVTANSPQVLADLALAAPAGFLTLTGWPPGLGVPTTLVLPPAAALTVMAQAPLLRVDRLVPVAAGGLHLSAAAPAVWLAALIAAPCAGLGLTGHAPARAGPLWRPASPNMTAWTPRASAGGHWTPVAGA